jgi:hypothetical protein
MKDPGRERPGDGFSLLRRQIRTECQFRNPEPGVLNGARSVGLDDVLQAGLKECPFVDLDAVFNFEHGCVVRLIDRSSFLQGFDIVEAF